MYRRTTALAVSAALLPCLAALTSCSSSASTPSKTAAVSSSAAGAASGNVGLSSAAANAAINAAAKDATSLQVKGNMETDGDSVALSLQFTKSSAAGTMTISNVPISFISVGGVTYFHVTSAFTSLLSGSASSADLAPLTNKWVPATNSTISPISSGFSTFASLTSFIGQVTSSEDQLTADGTGTVDGTPVAQYKDTDTSSTPTTTQVLSIAATGPALPLQEIGTGAGNTGTVTFTWNQPLTIASPPAADIYSGS